MALWLGLTTGISSEPSSPCRAAGHFRRADRQPRLFIAHGTLDAVIPIEAGGTGWRVSSAARVIALSTGASRRAPRPAAVARDAVVSTLLR